MDIMIELIVLNVGLALAGYVISLAHAAWSCRNHDLPVTWKNIKHMKINPFRIR